MKKLLFPGLLLLTMFLGSSFVGDGETPLVLASTKWISPSNDNCFQSLCFTSESTIMFYRCDDQLYYEVAYCIVGKNIEIAAFSNGSHEQTSKLILYEDNGVLRQLAGQVNTFPKNYILVPDSSCN